MGCGTGCALALLGILVALATTNPLLGAIVILGGYVAGRLFRRR